MRAVQAEKHVQGSASEQAHFLNHQKLVSCHQGKSVLRQASDPDLSHSQGDEDLRALHQKEHNTAKS